MISAVPVSSHPKGINYVDVGTSGGVWGLERGYCMMIGGPEAGGAQHRDPIFKTLAPGAGVIPRTPGRESLGGTAELGYLRDRALILADSAAAEQLGTNKKLEAQK